MPHQSIGASQRICPIYNIHYSSAFSVRYSRHFYAALPAGTSVKLGVQCSCDIKISKPQCGLVLGMPSCTLVQSKTFLKIVSYTSKYIFIKDYEAMLPCWIRQRWRLRYSTVLDGFNSSYAEQKVKQSRLFQDALSACSTPNG